MMEYISFHEFCKKLEISRENKGGALGKKLQKLDPSVRVSCVYNLLGPKDLVTPMDLFPPSHLSDIRCYQENVKVTYYDDDYLTAIRSATLIIQVSKANTIEARNAYSCRSVSLFKLGRYHESLFDANRSLREHWDEEERKSTNQFKSRCLEILLDDRYSSEKFKVKI